MISRRAASVLSDLYMQIFKRPVVGRSSTFKVNNEELYDFLYENDYEVWFCNAARSIKSSYNPRPLKDFIMRIQTGETIALNSIEILAPKIGAEERLRLRSEFYSVTNTGEYLELHEEIIALAKQHDVTLKEFDPP